MVDTISVMVSEVKLNKKIHHQIKYETYGGSKNKCYNKEHCICQHINNNNQNIHGHKLSIYTYKYHLLIEIKKNMDNYKSLIFISPRTYELLGVYNNLHPITQSQARMAFDHLAAILKQDGIEVDLFNAYLCRVDLFKNINLDRPYECYNGLMRALRANKLKKYYHENSLYFANTLRIINIYDKTRELKEKRKYETEHPNIMRIEYRMIKKQKCTSELHYSTLGELIDNWNDLDRIFTEIIDKLFFKNAKYAKNNKKRNELDELLYFYTQPTRSPFNAFLMAKGAEHVLAKLGDSSVLQRELIQNSLGAAPSRNMKKFEESLLQSQYANESGTTIGEMYTEIYNKLMSPVEDYVDDESINIF